MNQIIRNEDTISAFADLGGLQDVHPLSKEDDAFLADLTEVLKKHGNLNRFGLTLLHRHFEVAEDEMVVEHSDSVARTLSCSVMKRADIPTYGVETTQWRMTPDGKAIGIMDCVAQPDGNGHYTNGS